MMVTRTTWKPYYRYLESRHLTAQSLESITGSVQANEK